MKIALKKGVTVNQRALRVASSIRSHLTSLLPSFLQWDPDFRDERVHITHVRMSPDLRHALIFVSFSPHTSKDKESHLLKSLNKLTFLLQKKMAPLITHKFIPVLRFYEDHFLKEQEKIQNLLCKVQKDIQDE